MVSAPTINGRQTKKETDITLKRSDQVWIPKKSLRTSAYSTGIPITGRAVRSILLFIGFNLVIVENESLEKYDRFQHLNVDKFC